MTAAADIQRTVLIHHHVVTRDFGTCRALTINGGVTVIVYSGFIAINLRAGAAVADGIVAVVVDDGFITAVDRVNIGWNPDR
ncbi:hypothetical protein [Escherichia coli]|uniref:hypothetical protein n=1 Tax=Escherichia coli TaxID=562 RepID=UPI003207E760